MQLFTDFKLAHESVRKEVMCNIFSEFGKPTNSVQSSAFDTDSNNM